MDLGIKGKKALVLASSQGLGLGIATKLCEEGADVVVTGRREEKLAVVARKLNDDCPGQAEYIVIDLSEPGAADKLYAEATKRVGKIDILVNNTG